MRWAEQEVSDDHGVNRRRETVHTARDPTGREWIVEPHDDGSWLWLWWDPARDEPIAMGEGFKDAAAAQAAAERYAAEVLA